MNFYKFLLHNGIPGEHTNSDTDESTDSDSESDADSKSADDHRDVKSEKEEEKEIVDEVHKSRPNSKTSVSPKSIHRSPSSHGSVR